MNDIDAMQTVEMRAGPATAWVHPREGGRVGQIIIDGRRLLRGPEHGADIGWSQWGAYPLLPWSNRIPGGTVHFEGRTLAVPVNWPDGTALHGLAAEAPWTTLSADPAAVELTIDIDVGEYSLNGRQSLRLADTHLDITLGVENRGTARIPVGLGIHPWFKAGAIRVPADLVWPGETPIPDGPARPVTDDEDLRITRVAPVMDRCYTGLTESCADVPGLRLSWTGPITQVVVFTGVDGWVCVEPVTMANDGFRMADQGVAGHGVIALAPSESTEVSYRFTWTA